MAPCKFEYVANETLLLLFSYLHVDWVYRTIVILLIAVLSAKRHRSWAVEMGSQNLVF